MHPRSGLRVAVGASVLMMMSACGGGDPAPAASGGAGAVKDGGELRVYISEPRHLVSTNTTETEGSAVVRSISAGLITYGNEDYKIINVMAESINTTDSRTFTIKIKDGWKFHNGEAVNADSFVRAWNVGAYAPNAQTGGHFFERIEGYADLQGTAPKTKEMSGLKKVDDTTFTVTLRESFAGFPLMLGYNAFLPMAKACADDLKACDEAPIGNGPFKIDGKWEHKQQIKLVRNPDFKGDKAYLDKLTFKIYDKIDTAYNDMLAGNIDLMPRRVPPTKIADARAKFAGRFIEQPSPSYTYLGVPVYVDGYKNKLLRQAMSLAIDRKAIVDAVYQGSYTPAKSFSPPNFPGGRDNTCKYCEYNVDKAKELLAQAGGWPAGKKVELWFNAGGGHDTWMQAIGDQLKRNLGMDYELKGQLQFAEYLTTRDAKKFTGPFRGSWSPDYPLNENYLKPLYGTGGSSNGPGYSSPEFDKLIDIGDNGKSVDEAGKLYGAAEDLLAEEMPGIPLWYEKTAIAYADGLTGVAYNGILGIGYAKIGYKK
jgi:oligopeptide transport system substrate-binding protein